MRSLSDVSPPDANEEFFGNLALFTDAYFAIASTLPPPCLLKLDDHKLAVWKGTSGFDELTEDAYRRTWVGATRSPAYQARIDQRDADRVATGEASYLSTADGPGTFIATTVNVFVRRTTVTTATGDGRRGRGAN